MSRAWPAGDPLRPNKVSPPPSSSVASQTPSPRGLKNFTAGDVIGVAFPLLAKSAARAVRSASAEDHAALLVDRGFGR